jgi:hypothetical protein
MILRNIREVLLEYVDSLPTIYVIKVGAIRTSKPNFTNTCLTFGINDFRLRSWKWRVSICYNLHNVNIYTGNKPILKPTHAETCSPNPRVQVWGMWGRLDPKHFNFRRYAVKTQLQHNFDSRFSRDKMVNPWMTHCCIRYCQIYFTIAYTR